MKRTTSYPIRTVYLLDEITRLTDWFVMVDASVPPLQEYFSLHLVLIVPGRG